MISIPRPRAGIAPSGISLFTAALALLLSLAGTAQALIALFDQATSPRSAFNLPTFLPTLADQITADEGVSIALMATLGKQALSMNSRDIDNMTLPVKNFKGNDGRAYVVPVDTTQAVIDAFIAGLPFPR